MTDVTVTAIEEVAELYANSEYDDDVQEFIDDYDEDTLDKLIQLTKEHSDGEVTTRTIQNILDIDQQRVVEMMEVIYTLTSISSE